MKTPTQGKKFSKATQIVKRNIRKLRLAAGDSVYKGADLLGLSRKQMEDVETVRNYGCYISLDLMIAVCDAYNQTMSELAEQ